MLMCYDLARFARSDSALDSTKSQMLLPAAAFSGRRQDRSMPIRADPAGRQLHALAR